MTITDNERIRARVLSEKEIQAQQDLWNGGGWNAGKIPDLIATIKDRNITIAELREAIIQFLTDMESEEVMLPYGLAKQGARLYTLAQRVGGVPE